MVKTTLTAYLGISTHYTESLLEDLHSLLDEFCGLSGLVKLPMHDYGTPIAAINLLPAHSKDYPEIIDWWKGNLPSIPEVISIQTEVHLPEEASLQSHGGEIQQVKGSEALALHRLGARGRFTARIWDIIMVANIANAGVFNPVKSKIIQDGSPAGDIGGHIETTVLWDAREEAFKIEWPELQIVEFAKAWEWAINQPGFLDGFGDSSVGRALNAFTQVLNPDTALGTMQLFWALMGVEALYVEGSTGIMQQVREKSQAFLGPQESFKKKITQMYNFRSRLIHGDLDFPKYPIIFDADERLAKHDERLQESTALAVAILLATLQELIQRGWSHLRFHYEASQPLG